MQLAVTKRIPCPLGSYLEEEVSPFHGKHLPDRGKGYPAQTPIPTISLLAPMGALYVPQQCQDGDRQPGKLLEFDIPISVKLRIWRKGNYGFPIATPRVQQLLCKWFKQYTNTKLLPTFRKDLLMIRMEDRALRLKNGRNRSRS